MIMMQTLSNDRSNPLSLKDIIRDTIGIPILNKSSLYRFNSISVFLLVLTSINTYLCITIFVLIRYKIEIYI